MIMSRIGIFDSGVGGLTVLKEMKNRFPNNEYIYVGDNKNCPYGNKTKEELYTYATRIINYFILRKVETIIVACNTISSTILDDLKEEYNSVNIIGVIDATIKEFIKTGSKEVLVMATTAAIESGMYERKIKEYDSSIKVINLKAPLLVPAIEKNEGVEEIVKHYFKPYKNIDSIILGCTHYPLCIDYIKKYTDAFIISSSMAVVNTIKCITGEKSSTEIYTTGDVYLFNKICNFIMKCKGEYLNI